MFTYNPKAVEGQMCLESSPNDNKVFFMHTSRAIMLEVGVVFCLSLGIDFFSYFQQSLDQAIF